MINMLLATGYRTAPFTFNINVQKFSINSSTVQHSTMVNHHCNIRLLYRCGWPNLSICPPQWLCRNDSDLVKDHNDDGMSKPCQPCGFCILMMLMQQMIHLSMMISGRRV